MNPTLDRRKFLPISDIIPQSLETLSFQIDEANADVLLIIQNKSVQDFISGTSDEDGIFTIQVRGTEETPTDLLNGPAWFNSYAGLFYFKIFVDNEPLPIAINFEGVSFQFFNAIGDINLNPVIDLTGNTTTPPEEDFTGITADNGDTLITDDNLTLIL